MTGINKVILVGRLGGDPEVKYMPNGNAVANITIATSESWSDKTSGEKREKTEWHRVVIFGKTAEVAGQYLKKGAQVYIEGQLQTRKWQDQNGQDRYTTEVVVQGFNGVMQMLGGRNQASDYSADYTSYDNNSNAPAANNSYSNPVPPQNTRTSAPAPKAKVQQPQYNEPSADFDDEIPF